MEPQVIFNEISESEEILPSFSQTDNLQEFIAEYSEVPYDETYQTKAQLGTYANTLFELKEGVVFGPYKDGSQFKLSRMIDLDRGGSVKAAIFCLLTRVHKAHQVKCSNKSRSRAYRVLRWHVLRLTLRS